MKKLKLFALASLTFMSFSGAANAETVLLASDDFVGISFLLFKMACFRPKFVLMMDQTLRKIQMLLFLTGLGWKFIRNIHGVIH